MCSGNSSVPRISSGSRLRLKSKTDESRNCNRDREKGMREGDYCRMVRLFGGELLSSHGFFPLSAMALEFSWRSGTTPKNRSPWLGLWLEQGQDSTR
jgi:hypothetical protein